MGFVLVLVGVLAVYNNATNLLRLPAAAYVPVNLAATAALLAAARLAGYRWATLGLGAGGLGAGARWGAAAVAVVGTALLVASALPWARPLLADQRVAGIGLAGLVWQALVRIPLGTVLFEEVAFRGVLLGTWAGERAVGEALVGSSLVFGIWHVGPTIRLLQANGMDTGSAGAVLAVAAAVAATAAAGVVLGWLRLRTGGVLAPALAHLAANSLGLVAAYAAQR